MLIWAPSSAEYAERPVAAREQPFGLLDERFASDLTDDARLPSRSCAGETMQLMQRTIKDTEHAVVAFCVRRVSPFVGVTAEQRRCGADERRDRGRPVLGAERRFAGEPSERRQQQDRDQKNRPETDIP